MSTVGLEPATFRLPMTQSLVSLFIPYRIDVRPDGFLSSPLLFLSVDEKNWQSDIPYKRHYAHQESKKRWTQFLYLQVTWQCLIAEKLCHLVISFKFCSTFLNISPIILFFLLTCKLTFEQINKSLHTDHFNCWAVRNNKTCLLPFD